MRNLTLLTLYLKGQELKKLMPRPVLVGFTYGVVTNLLAVLVTETSKKGRLLSCSVSIVNESAGW